MNKLLKLGIFCFAIWNHSFLSASSVTISANPSTFVVNAAIAAGQGLQTVSNTSTTWGCTNSSATQTAHITGQISAAITQGTMQIKLSGSSGTSAGYITLSTTAQTLFSSIPTSTTLSSQAISYTFGANINGAQVTNATTTLTLTFLNP